jgi:hypothetical protein
LLAHVILVYLTPAPRKVVGVEVLLLVDFWACPSLPCKLDAWFVSGDYGIGETALAVHLFLLFLVCLPCGAAADEQLGFGSEKFIYGSPLALPGRQHW